MARYFESNEMELKEKLNDKFVREVVAFLNADGGKIIIGVKDDGSIVGVAKIDSTLKQIAEIISDQIEPVAIDCVKPEILFEEGKVLIAVTVQKGLKPIYCIKKFGFSSIGCPIRIGSTCREMNEEQIANRYKLRFLNNDLLIESTTNLPQLSFHSLKEFYLDKGYKLNPDTFETNFYLVASSGKYNLMGELLSDNNRFSLIFVKFKGTGKAAISQRTDYGKRSLLFAYEQLMNRIASENICMTNTLVRPRVDTYLFDYDCVREAVINAIVHNDWTVSEPQVSFYSDRLEILSHGGLPHGLTTDEFFQGISRPRNLKLMKVFSDLDIVDHTGHGIPTIIEKYGEKVFEISDNYIMVTIPFQKDVASMLGGNKSIGFSGGLNPMEETIVTEIMVNPRITRSELTEKVGKSSRTIDRYLVSLVEKGVLVRQGSKKSGQWKVVK